MHRTPTLRTGGLFACLALLLTLALAAAPVLAAEGDDASAALTDEERAHVVELLESSQAQTEELAAQAEGDLWSTEPAPESWSVGEVVEHLVLAEEMFYGLLTQTLESDPNPDWQAVADAGTSGLETTVQDRSQKFQAPEQLQPTGEVPRDELLARYATARARTLELVASLDGPIKRHTFTGPPGTMNVHQWLILVGAHNLRHNQQIEEALEAVR